MQTNVLINLDSAKVAAVVLDHFAFMLANVTWLNSFTTKC